MAELFDLQYRFAAHLRDPQQSPPAGLEERRLAIYRSLFFNSLQSLLSSNFPVLRKLLDGPRWTALIRDFYRDYRAATPLFTELPREFLNYLQQREGHAPDDPPYLLELAHYEWVELALGISEHDLDSISENEAPDLLQHPVQLSPLAWLLAYRFPVHRIGPAWQPAEAPAQPTHLVVVRNRKDQIGFIELNAVSARLLSLIEQAPGRPAIGHLRQIADELRNPQQTLIAAGTKLLEQMRQRDVLLWPLVDSLNAPEPRPE